MLCDKEKCEFLAATNARIEEQTTELTAYKQFTNQIKQLTGRILTDELIDDLLKNAQI